MRIVCNLERPSELSWRARHGRKKKRHLSWLRELQVVDVIDARNLCQGTLEGKGGALSINARDPYVELFRTVLGRACGHRPTACASSNQNCNGVLSSNPAACHSAACSVQAPVGTTTLSCGTRRGNPTHTPAGGLVFIQPDPWALGNQEPPFVALESVAILAQAATAQDRVGLGT